MHDSILQRNIRDPLFGLTAIEFENALRRKLVGRVEAAYFFGSYGSASFGPDSDIDLILVTETTEPFVERSKFFSDLLDLIPAMDLLVYTPREFKDLTRAPSPGFWRSVVTTLRQVL